jgi:DNA N-6-adenine-methyltransferase (Dam)
MREQLFTSPVRLVDTDERFTPRWIFDAIGDTFDLDPASPVDGGDHVPALVKYTRHDDGLAQPWRGYVWCNPPFSDATRWADRFRAHANGVWLGPVANARWWIDLANAAHVMLHSRDFAFDHPVHAGRRSSMPLAFIALGQRGTAAVRRLALSGRIQGALVVSESEDSDA